MEVNATCRDTHLHLVDLLAHEPQALHSLVASGCRVISSCHQRLEFEAHEQLLQADPLLHQTLAISFGIHPQKPVADEYNFLVSLTKPASDGRLRLAAIGECGFDFFHGRAADGPNGEPIQSQLFLLQAELAKLSGLPLVVHLRHATDCMFRYHRLLRQLPAVIFHSWPGSPEEGQALLGRGINAYFSLGTPLLQGKKTTRLSLLRLPRERLLLESDAPYQTLKDQKFSDSTTIRLVYRQAASLLGIPESDLSSQIAANFDALFAHSFAICSSPSNKPTVAPP